jgi:GntR family transcriptional regulator / MocR family aminotransferase
MMNPPRTRRGRILKVALDRESSSPLYTQIYQSLRQDILSGLLTPAMPLPSTRHLAADLGVARSTVVQAYEQLRAEGYVEGVLGAGTRVSTSLPDQHLRVRAAEPRPAGTMRSARVSKAFTAVADIPRRAPAVLGRPPRAFRVGVPAVDVFPVDIWGRILARRWSHTPPRQLSYGEPFGHMPLRSAVAEYLRAARGVRCVPEQVLITSGSQQAIDLCARVLLDPGDEAWIEDPGYHGARGALVGAGARVVPVPVDDQGLVVAEGRRLAPNARLAFVTPSRQLPLGVTMSQARRLELLDWAASNERWIIEDDFDCEFRYASRPLSALQGLDTQGCVLYTGTFSKVMFPALRLGYLVVPDALIDALGAARHYAGYHSPYLEQAVMADFIADGHFERHIRRMRSIYHERQRVLLEALDEHLADEVSPDRTDAGMTLIAWLHHRDDASVAYAAQRAGIDLVAMSWLAIDYPVRSGLLLGYSGVCEADLREGVRRLAEVFAEMQRPGPARGHSADRRLTLAAARG